MPNLFFDRDEAREIPTADNYPILLTQIIAGAAGPTGAQGPQGPQGPAPTGTGFVYVDHGTIVPPFEVIDAGTF